MVVHRSAVKADQRIGSNRVQDFFGNFFASVGFFFGWVVPAQDAPGQAFGTAVLRGQHFGATVCALRGPFLVVLRDPLVRVETTLAHQQFENKEQGARKWL